MNCAGVKRSARVRVSTSADQRSSTVFNIRDPQVFSSPNVDSAQRLHPAEEDNRQHVETHNDARRRAGGPVASAALLHGRRNPKVLLRGIAQGHISCWYGLSFLEDIYLETLCTRHLEADADNRPLPRRSLG